MEILCRRAKRAYVQNCSPAKTQETELCHSMGRHHVALWPEGEEVRKAAYDRCKGQTGNRRRSFRLPPLTP
jgi:hypothetical protein